MNSFVYFNCAVLLLYLPWVQGLAQNNSTSSPENKSGTNLNMTTLDVTNASSNCTLRMDELAIENIFRFMQDYTTRVVEIKVSINSGNKTQRFPELIWPWANGIGRTIISLKAQSASSLHVATLTPGIKKVDMVVFEGNYGCLPKGKNGLERVFDFLLHRVSHSDDTHNYKLCRAFGNDLKQYNCCRVASGGKLTICAEYSSILLKYAESAYIWTMPWFIVFVGFPLIWLYLLSIPYEIEYYEITDSPMALSTIFYTVFIEGSKTPVKLFYRRLAFSLTVSVIFGISTYSQGRSWCIFSAVWAIIFISLDYFIWRNDASNEDVTNENVTDENVTNEDVANNTKKNIVNYETYIRLLMIPLNIKFLWNTFK